MVDLCPAEELHSSIYFWNQLITFNLNSSYTRTQTNTPMENISICWKNIATPCWCLSLALRCRTPVEDSDSASTGADFLKFPMINIREIYRQLHSFFFFIRNRGWARSKIKKKIRSLPRLAFKGTLRIRSMQAWLKLWLRNFKCWTLLFDPIYFQQFR